MLIIRVSLPLNMPEIKQISNRISYCEGRSEYTMVITPPEKSTRFYLLTLWLSTFVLCGIVVSIQLFLNYSREIKLFFVVFLVFWLYYVLMAGRVWLFYSRGGEFIRVCDGKFFIKRAIGTYGKTHDFLIQNMKRIEMRNAPSGSFSWELEKSYWVLGGHSLVFDYNGREVRLGIRLDKKEAGLALRILNEWIKKEKITQAS